MTCGSLLSPLSSLLTLRTSLLLLALLVADGVVVYDAMGPCEIDNPDTIINSIGCTGSIYPPLPPGCMGSVNAFPEQSHCAGLESSPCTDEQTILAIVCKPVLVPTYTGPCYGVAVGFLGLTTIQTYDCGIGFPVVYYGGGKCN